MYSIGTYKIGHEVIDTETFITMTSKKKELKNETLTSIVDVVKEYIKKAIEGKPEVHIIIMSNIGKTLSVFSLLHY